MAKKYDEMTVVNNFRRNSAVNVSGNRIEVNGFVGIKVRGKLDFLRKYCGYSVMIN